MDLEEKAKFEGYLGVGFLYGFVRVEKQGQIVEKQRTVDLVYIVIDILDVVIDALYPDIDTLNCIFDIFDIVTDILTLPTDNIYVRINARHSIVYTACDPQELCSHHLGLLLC